MKSCVFGVQRGRFLLVNYNNSITSEFAVYSQYAGQEGCGACI